MTEMLCHCPQRSIAANSAFPVESGIFISQQTVRISDKFSVKWLFFLSALSWQSYGSFNLRVCRSHLFPIREHYNAVTKGSEGSMTLSENGEYVVANESGFLVIRSTTEIEKSLADLSEAAAKELAPDQGQRVIKTKIATYKEGGYGDYDGRYASFLSDDANTLVSLEANSENGFELVFWNTKKGTSAAIDEVGEFPDFLSYNKDGSITSYSEGRLKIYGTKRLIQDFAVDEIISITQPGIPKHAKVFWDEESRSFLIFPKKTREIFDQPFRLSVNGEGDLKNFKTFGLYGMDNKEMVIEHPFFEQFNKNLKDLTFKTVYQRNYNPEIITDPISGVMERLSQASLHYDLEHYVSNSQQTVSFMMENMAGHAELFVLKKSSGALVRRERLWGRDTAIFDFYQDRFLVMGEMETEGYVIKLYDLKQKDFNEQLRVPVNGKPKKMEFNRDGDLVVYTAQNKILKYRFLINEGLN